jgi:hypothetical protein
MKYYFTLSILLSVALSSFSQVTPPSDTTVVVSCDNYVSNGGIVYTSDTVYLDTLVVPLGQDSSFYTDLTINAFIEPVLNVDPAQCAPNPSFNFTASSPNPLIQNFRWYNQLTAGSLINVGSTYMDSFPTTTSLYVVQAGASAPMPVESSLNTVSNTGGYWFVAPNAFVITSLFVPTLDSSKFQNVAVVKMDGNIPPPTASLSTNDFTTLYISQVNSTRGSISVNISIQQGDIIGIFGSRESDNSYSNTNNQTLVNGDIIPLTPLGYPGKLTTTDPYNISSFPLSVNISRVQFEYSSNNVCIKPTRTEIEAVVNPTFLTPIDTAVCDSFLTADGRFFDFSTTVLDTLQSVNSCDSVLQYNLTVNYSSFDSILAAACDSFVSPSGVAYFSSTMFYDTTFYASGCRNVKHIDLTVSYSSIDTTPIVRCDEFTTPMGAVLTTDTLFPELLQSSKSCDSLVYFDVTINPSKFTIDTVNTCDSHTSLSGNIYDTSAVYYDSLQTNLFCDSLVEVVLIMNYSTLDSQVEVHCDSYTSPNGTLYTISELFYDTIPTVNNCDSVIYIDLTINNSTTEALPLTECDSYISPAGDVYNASAIFTDTLQTSKGCDSIINVNLTINYSTQEDMFPVVCDTFVSPLGNGYNSSSIFTEVLTTALGCDSSITIFLTVNDRSIENLSITACDTFVSPAGDVYTASAVFSDTLTGALTCDSILNIDLTIVSSTMEVLNETVCDIYTSPLGDVYMTSQTIFDTLQSVNGCDSVLQIELTVNQSVNDTVYPIVCEEYISGGLFAYDSSGVYTESYLTLEGCDSMVTIVLEVDPLILTVSKEHSLLESLDFEATYQWINCTTGALISGETNRMFTAYENESFAVIVDNSYCMDTSECVMVNSIGTGIFWIENVEFSLYPNPASEIVTITSSENLENLPYIIVDLKGSIVGEGILNGTLNRIPVHNLEQGMYFIQMENHSIPILKTDN